ncbi:MAG: hypothetical protein J6R60_04090 [Clostridia bacterium]|nr:hypothetical protein [Clostridia bacterium]
MKKIITLALVLSMLALLIVPSFADSTEEEKIIEAAQKGTVLYELLDYRYPAPLSVIQNVNHPKDENYDFIYEMVPDINDETEYILSSEEYNPENMFIVPTAKYIKMSDSIKSAKDFEKIVSKYLTGYTAIIDDENTVEKDDKGFIIRQPLIRTIDDSVCLHVGAGNFKMTYPYIFFEEFTLESNNGKMATVKAAVNEDFYGDDEYDGAIPFDYYTIELKKVNGQWKVCGGTLFSDFLVECDEQDYLFTPPTGEDFSLITHTLVIGVCAALMLVLSKRRKIEI